MTVEILKRANEISQSIHDIDYATDAINSRDFSQHGLDIGNAWDNTVRINKDIIDTPIINTVVTLIRSALETKKQALEKELESL
jgi:hypothetical protein